jgi:hypothetical protein
MTKRDIFYNMILFEVVKSFQEVYGFPPGQLTTKQESMIRVLTDRLVKLFGDSMTVKDLQEKVSEISKTV